MLDLSESRAQIDVIDKEITRLFQKRIDVCRDVAAYMASAICLHRSWQFAASVSIRS